MSVTADGIGQTYRRPYFCSGKIVKRKRHQDYFIFVIKRPLVLYNGADHWTACRQFKECLAGAEQFGKYVVDFEYFLIDVNRYSAKELLGFRNLIGGVFFLDQKKDKDELLRRLEELIETLEKLEPDLYRLFAVWLKNIAVLGFPEKYKEVIGKVIDESNPKEARKMVSNLSETLKKAYDEVAKSLKIPI